MSSTLFDPPTHKATADKPPRTVREAAIAATTGHTTPGLIEAVRAKREASKHTLTNEEREAALSRYAFLREHVLLGKEQLVDSGKYDHALSEAEAEVFCQKLAKLDGWLDEYEALVAKLARDSSLPPEACCARCGAAVYDPWAPNDACDGCRTGKAKELVDRIAAQGWATFRTDLCGAEEVMLVTRRPDSEPPAGLERCLRFTLGELRLLRGLGKEALRTVCEVKRGFGGEVES